MTICVYEDDKYQQFYPLTYLRPVSTLRAGIVPLFERAHRYFPEARVVLVAREEIAPLTVLQQPDIPVNIIKRQENEPVLFVNGRVRSWGDLSALVNNARLTTRFISDTGETAAVLFVTPTVNHTSKVTTPSEYLDVFNQERRDIPDCKTTVTLYNHLWELVADIESEIAEDFRHLNHATAPTSQVDTGAYVIEPKQVVFGDGVRVLPGAVIDASSGPVYIGANTRVEAHAAIYGPSAIGANCVVTAGKYNGVSIGHTCRIGGEVEESIFQSYVNKYHAGFIGHSYVGSWVNFGAMTTNSDLKNNYSPIRVQVGGKSIDTGSIKVGSFIGDHSKFGIGTLLNTGIVVGVCCNVFGGTLIADKDVPSFQWGNTANWEVYQFAKALETASRTCERRAQKLSEQERTALKMVFDQTSNPDGCLSFV